MGAARLPPPPSASTLLPSRHHPPPHSCDSWVARPSREGNGFPVVTEWALGREEAEEVPGAPGWCPEVPAAVHLTGPYDRCWDALLWICPGSRDRTQSCGTRELRAGEGPRRPQGTPGDEADRMSSARSPGQQRVKMPRVVPSDGSPGPDGTVSIVTVCQTKMADLRATGLPAGLTARSVATWTLVAHWTAQSGMPPPSQKVLRDRAGPQRRSF